jgi:hypothetical protein
VAVERLFFTIDAHHSKMADDLIESFSTIRLDLQVRKIQMGSPTPALTIGAPEPLKLTEGREFRNEKELSETQSTTKFPVEIEHLREA